jgi:hypothetical protein
MNPRPDVRAALLALGLGAATAGTHAAPVVSDDAAVAAASSGTNPAPETLQAYKARYEVSYKGLTGGQIVSGLRPDTVPGQWIYESRAYPNVIVRLAVSSEANEHAVMQLTPNGVRPLRFTFNDGKGDLTKDVRLAFDWTTGRVKGEAQGKPVDLTVAPGTQDTASVQAAMMLELLAGRAPQSFPVVTGDRLREYRYWFEGHATITPPLGRYDTVIWSNQREGSSRMLRVWYAPSLGYVPVQAMQLRNGTPQVQMQIVSLEQP